MKLSITSRRQVIKALSKIGFKIVGRKGSPVRMRKETEQEIIVLVVPDHKELAPGTLNDIIKKAKLTREELINLLK